MREIKFRAWNKETDKMMYPDDSDSYFELTDAGLNVLDLTQEPDNLGFSHFDVDIQQYTGLKDKNGVEIYEGDVLSGWIQSHWHSGEDKFEEVVKYDEKTASYNFPAIEVRHGDLRVIGNIYENPELLEVQNG